MPVFVENCIYHGIFIANHTVSLVIGQEINIGVESWLRRRGVSIFCVRATDVYDVHVLKLAA